MTDKLNWIVLMLFPLVLKTKQKQTNEPISRIKIDSYSKFMENPVPL